MPYIPQTTHITLLATLRRDRFLPRPGDITVQPRQHVEPGDVVARALVPERHHLVNYARALDEKIDKADEYLVKGENETVKKNEAIAFRKGFLGFWGRAKVPSPADGKIVMFTGRGEALVAAISKPLELRAGMPGDIINIIEHWGVTIETTGALLEGVWGNGLNEYAPLQLVGDNPQSPLTPNLIDMNLRGHIIAVGAIIDDTSFKALTEVRAKGLIVGTVTPKVFPLLQKLKFPVLIADGFGERGLSEPTYAFLSGNSQRPGWLNAQPFNFITNQHPEFILPLPTPAAPPLPPAAGEALGEGKRVRILRGPDAGQVGTVVTLFERPQLIESGLRVRVASVELASTPGTTIKVPFANLENLE